MKKSSRKTEPENGPPVSGEAEIILSRALGWHQAGDLAHAEAAYRQLLRLHPGNDAALHLLGVLMHQRGRNTLAQELIEAAIKLNDAEATYYFNLAEIQRAANNPLAAIPAYRRAVALDASQADYYFGLGSALTESGEAHQAAECLQQALGLAPDDPEVHNNLGNVLAEAGELERAERHLTAAITRDPEYVEARVNLGNVQKERGDHDAAVASYRAALALDPDNAGIHYNLALALDEDGQTQQAVAGYRRAITLNPDMPAVHANLGRILREAGDTEAARQCYQMELGIDARSQSALYGLATLARDAGDFSGAVKNYRALIEMHPDDVTAHALLGDSLAKLDRYDEAIAHIDHALVLDPDSAEAHFNRGICLQALGRFDAAVKSHRRALALNPALAEAAYNLALIGHESLVDDDLQSMMAMARDTDLEQQARINLHFALAKTFKDRGRHPQAFVELQAGNDLKASGNPFRPEFFSAYVDRVIETFDAAFFDHHQGYGLDSEVPVFIVGMPRSGSTLVEQIIASHPLAYGAGELGDLRILIKRLPQMLGSVRDEPECVPEMNAELAVQLAREHLQKLLSLAPDAHRVCDKMLGNFLKLGLIFLLFPRARIIHCLRDPRDMGLSCYFQNFSRGLKFTYRLDHLGLVYRDYCRLMAHWREVLPMRLHEVQYERLVDEQEETSRELIEFCGLDWNPRCLDFHRQQRGVNTASFWQVRQPLYRSSVGQWRDFEQLLHPLIDALGDLASAYPPTPR